MNAKTWIDGLVSAEKKKALPILSFPSVSLLGVTVRELIESSELQAEGMKRVAERVPSAASVSMMDLSVEAEAFGSAVRLFDDEVPTVVGRILTCEDDAKNLRVPKVGEGRTGRYVEAIGKAAARITDRPVLAGIIGPFSLAGRLMDVTEALVNCYDEPEMVHAAMEKTAAFLAEYALAYKRAGAAGVVMAEPLTGLLSPNLAAEFSEPYVRRVIEAVQSDDFIVIYHNCGNSVLPMSESIFRVGAAGYHFGNSIDLKEMLDRAPAGVPVMGNVDPAGQFKAGTPASIREATLDVMRRCGEYRNFVISSGCDIPPSSPWENIDAFFAAVDEFYAAL